MLRPLSHTCLLVLVGTLLGCGTNAPDVAEVKSHMSSEQVALGDPLVNSVGVILVPVPAGEFQMGTAVSDASLEERFQKLMEDPDVQKKLGDGETSEKDLKRFAKWRTNEDKKHKNGPETPQHAVHISTAFFLSAFEITQGQYKAVMNEEPWAGQPLVEEGPDYAATYISWEKAAEFCRKLTDQEGIEYRLPTETEWEYACRAGTTTTYSFGNNGKDLGNHAWHDANAYKNGEQYAHIVGQKSPNPWALYDMHGNTWEWCQDWYARYGQRQKELVDPTGPEKGRHRVWRGGSFAENPINMRSASRLSYNRTDYRPDFAAGFRILRVMAL